MQGMVWSPSILARLCRPEAREEGYLDGEISQRQNCSGQHSYLNPAGGVDSLLFRVVFYGCLMKRAILAPQDLGVGCGPVKDYTSKRDLWQTL